MKTLLAILALLMLFAQGCAESYETIHARHTKRLKDSGALYMYGEELDRAIEKSGSSK